MLFRSPFSRRTHRVRTAKMSLYIKNPSRNSSFRRFREHIEKEMRINMSVTFAGTMRGYEKKNIIKDVIAGIIIMAVSIPISMGYAQIAGLPAVCGLYGSVFPIIAFALLSTSPQFVFGVDAAPAALVGSALISFGIESGSKEALTAVDRKSTRLNSSH